MRLVRPVPRQREVHGQHPLPRRRVGRRQGGPPRRRPFGQRVRPVRRPDHGRVPQRDGHAAIVGHAARMHTRVRAVMQSAEGPTGPAPNAAQCAAASARRVPGEAGARHPGPERQNTAWSAGIVPARDARQTVGPCGLARCDQVSAPKP